jgi:hypothetical protein
MLTKRFLLVACAAAFALAIFPAITQAQGPLYDKVIVNLPYTVTIGDHVLQPGPYVIRQAENPGGSSQVLRFYSDDGRQFETSALTIPVEDIGTARDTKLVLHHFGQDYYMDKIWIQGKNYGYEFPLPANVKARERERLAPLTVAATYQAEAPPQEVAQAAPPPAPAEQPAPAPQEAPAPAPAPVEAAPAPAPAPAPPPAMPTTSRLPLLSKTKPLQL